MSDLTPQPTPLAAALAAEGLRLPAAAAPAANYQPWVRSGDLLFVSGQVSQMEIDGETHAVTGKLGAELALEDGIRAARICGLRLVAQLLDALGGDETRLVRVVKLTGFVNSTPAFTQQPQVINGCSDLLVALFGEAGRHARSAVSAPALPRGVAVEIEAIFEIR